LATLGRNLLPTRDSMFRSSSLVLPLFVVILASTCRNIAEHPYLSLSFSLSLSIYTTEQAYNQTVELAVCSFLNGSLSRILELIFYHFVYQKNIRDSSFFFDKNMFLLALPLFYQSSLSKRHNYNFHFAISEFIFLCVEKTWKVFPFCIPSYNTNLSVTSFSFDRFPIKTKVNMLPQ
jgi:hypothetical protein